MTYSGVQIVRHNKNSKTVPNGYVRLNKAQLVTSASVVPGLARRVVRVVDGIIGYDMLGTYRKSLDMVTRKVERRMKKQAWARGANMITNAKFTPVHMDSDEIVMVGEGTLVQKAPAPRRVSAPRKKSTR